MRPERILRVPLHSLIQKVKRREERTSRENPEGFLLGVYLKDVKYDDAPWEHEATKFAKEQYNRIFNK